MACDAHKSIKLRQHKKLRESKVPGGHSIKVSKHVAPLAGVKARPLLSFSILVTHISTYYIPSLLLNSRIDNLETLFLFFI